jgi:hypothetical protein
MRHVIPSAVVLSCLATAGCASVDPGLRNTVILHYQHVANVHQIDFTTPVVLPRRSAPVHAVLPLESAGFWAVFLLCSLDVTAPNIPSFYFDLDRFHVDDGDRRYGPLRPYTLRLDDTADLNGLGDTAALAEAIAMELQKGPSTQIFRHGYYPRLDYRFAIYVPRALSDYSGDQLPLRYENGPTMVLGNDYPPAELASAGAGGPSIAGHCLP